MNLDLIVFNVEHGLCAFVRTPSGHGVMVDVGCSSTFKPAEWLADPMNIELVPHQGLRLAKLYVTHPHDDHVEGITSLIQNLPPAILQAHRDYDWNRVLNPPDSDPSENAKTYHRWQQMYTSPVASHPDFGCKVESFGLSPAQAAVVGGSMQNQLNNSSLVVVISTSTWKVVICGDNEERGLEALMARSDFRMAISGADVLVTPHHGHSSGYCQAFMDALGSETLSLCISSVPAKDAHLDSRYGSRCYGVQFNGDARSHLTTRRDGDIWLTLLPDQHYRFNQVKRFDINAILRSLIGERRGV